MNTDRRRRALAPFEWIKLVVTGQWLVEMRTRQRRNRTHAQAREAAIEANKRARRIDARCRHDPSANADAEAANAVWHHLPDEVLDHFIADQLAHHPGQERASEARHGQASGKRIPLSRARLWLAIVLAVLSFLTSILVVALVATDRLSLIEAIGLVTALGGTGLTPVIRYYYDRRDDRPRHDR